MTRKEEGESFESVEGEEERLDDDSSRRVWPRSATTSVDGGGETVQVMDTALLIGFGLAVSE